MNSRLVSVQLRFASLRFYNNGLLCCCLADVRSLLFIHHHISCAGELDLTIFRALFLLFQRFLNQ